MPSYIKNQGRRSPYPSLIITYRVKLANGFQWTGGEKSKFIPYNLHTSTHGTGLRSCGAKHFSVASTTPSQGPPLTTTTCSDKHAANDTPHKVWYPVQLMSLPIASGGRWHFQLFGPGVGQLHTTVLPSLCSVADALAWSKVVAAMHSPSWTAWPNLVESTDSLKGTQTNNDFLTLGSLSTNCWGLLESGASSLDLSKS